MDVDIIAAIRLEASEQGISDEAEILKLIDGYRNSSLNNNDNNNDNNNQQEYCSDDNRYKAHVEALKLYRNDYDYELTNQQAQINAYNQYVHRFHQQNQQQNAGFAMQNIFNMFLGNMPFAGNVQIDIENPLGGGLNIGDLNNVTGILNNMINQLTQVRVPVTLTESALTKLEDLEYNKLKEKYPNIQDDDACPICLDKLNEETEGKTYNALPCKHIFHTYCIKPYFKDYDYHCPVCREEGGDHEAKIEN